MRALGGEEQELLTANKPFPTLRSFFTREGNSTVSQEVASSVSLVGMAPRPCVLLAVAT